MPKFPRPFSILHFVFSIFVFVLAYSLFTFHFSPPVRASHCPSSDLDCQIQELQREIDAFKPAHEKNKAELANLQKQLASIKARITSLTSQLNALEKDIQKREGDLEVRGELFEEKTRRHYMVLRQHDPLAPFLLADSAINLLRQLTIRQKVITQDQEDIIDIAKAISKLEEDQQTLKKNRESLTAAQASLDKNAKFLAGEVSKVESYIASLSSKQQNLIAQKLASLNLPTSLGAGPLLCTDDRKLNPGFSPAFAFYTYGIPHRVGLNQYGAYGRANAGQNYRDILNAYFQGVNFETKENINISVKGYGSMPLETYLLGIYEMPGSWPLEALKAQAVAARSYALSYTGNGSKEICTTQACQVYKGGNKGGNWETAVKATAGEVLTSQGAPITAWYASTFGGYALQSSDVGWNSTPWTKRVQDTTGGIGSFDDLNQKAYDKDSPCFYAAQGVRREYSKSAWLKSEEVADIVNVLKLAKADSGTQNHLSQPDKPNPDGTDTWDAGRVKSELSSRGISAYSSISSVSISGWDTGIGKTTSVSVSGDGGSETFSGDEFKSYFNLRAPANIQIVGPLFNIERK